MAGSAKCQFAKDKTIFRCMIRSAAHIANKPSDGYSSCKRTILLAGQKIPSPYAHRSLKAVFTRVLTAKYIYFTSNFFTIICPSTPRPFTWLYPFTCFDQNFVYVSGCLSLSVCLSVSLSILKSTKFWDAKFRIVLNCI